MNFVKQLRLYQVQLPYLHDTSALPKAIANKLGIELADLLHWRIIKQSLDTRPPKKPQWIYCLDIELKNEIALPKDAEIIPSESEETKIILGKLPMPDSIPPIIVGSGPAGLLAGYWLARFGYRPMILEQGEPIENRHRALTQFFNTRQLNPYANYVFGEGGAGTYSDGKLYTGVSSGWIGEILKVFIQHGAPPEIAYQSPPHIGSDRLRAVMVRMRRQIQAWGGEFFFRHRVIDMEIKNSSSPGNMNVPFITLMVEKADGTVQHIPASVVIWGTGSHCRETFCLLQRAGIVMEAKPFQLGVRVEHPQKLINQRQYRQYAHDPCLPPANYRLVMPKLSGIRQMCSFCMCPGGEIIPASDRPFALVTNGMSNYHRNSEFANAALVITLQPEDWGSKEALDGLVYRSHLEKAAFELGGSNYTAPAQRVQDFLRNSPSQGNMESSYRLQLRGTSLRQLLPALLLQSLDKALPIFDKQIPHFIQQGILVAPETRASCPVRILRHPQTRNSLSCNHLYPVGEGAGYAGGIISAAVDGLKTAALIMQTWAPLA